MKQRLSLLLPFHNVHVFLNYYTSMERTTLSWKELLAYALFFFCVFDWVSTFVLLFNS